MNILLKYLKIKKINYSSFARNAELLFLALPVIIYIFIFRYLPMGGVVLAFKNYNYVDGILGSPWAGFKNFALFFKSDAAFVVTVNTLLYNLFFIVAGTIIYAIVALLLNEVRSKAAIKAYQTVIFFPHFMSWVVVAGIVYCFLSHENGIFNRILQAFGHKERNWYHYPSAWPGIIVFFGIWKHLGMNVLINYAVLIGIDKSYYDAASIDGANRLQAIWHISVPALIPIVLIQFILAIGRIFNADFGLFYQLTRGSGILYKTTEVIDTYIFKTLMDVNDIGMGAAVGLYQSLVGMGMVLIANYVICKIDSDYGLF